MWRDKMHKFKWLKEGRTGNVEYCDEKGMFVVMRKIDPSMVIKCGKYLILYLDHVGSKVC